MHIVKAWLRADQVSQLCESAGIKLAMQNLRLKWIEIQFSMFQTIFVHFIQSNESEYDNSDWTNNFKMKISINKNKARPWEIVHSIL